MRYIGRQIREVYSMASRDAIRLTYLRRRFNCECVLFLCKNTSLRWREMYRDSSCENKIEERKLTPRCCRPWSRSARRWPGRGDAWRAARRPARTGRRRRPSRSHAAPAQTAARARFPDAARFARTPKRTLITTLHPPSTCLASLLTPE